MRRYPTDRGPFDSRWDVVEDRDTLGRPVFAFVPRVGERFGSLVVLCSGFGKRSKSRFRCDCGAECELPNRQLFDQTYCGKCGYKAATARLHAANPEAAIMPDYAVRSVWTHRYTGIISRCYNPSCRAYKNYGGRGIRMCAEWLNDRSAFLRHAITLPDWDKPGLDMDRRNNEGHYEPGNIRLVPRSINTRNKRDNSYIVHQGRRLTHAEFRERFCPEWRSPNAFYHHLNQGRTARWIVDHYRKTRGGV